MHDSLKALDNESYRLVFGFIGNRQYCGKIPIAKGTVLEINRKDKASKVGFYS